MVTGAAGFLGSELCQQLIEAGAKVTGVDDFSACTNVPNNPMSNDPILRFKLQDDKVRFLISETDFHVIFHLAGLAYAAHSVIDPVLDFDANLQATVRFLETLQQAGFRGRLIYTSSAAVYGQPKDLPITENTAPAPISPYGASKLSAEHYIRMYSNLYSFRAVIARLFSVYGPGQRKQVVFDLVSKALQSDGVIELLGDGTEIRDFIYVEDADSALLYLGSLPSTDGKVFNVCSGQGTSIRTLAEIIIKVMGDDVRRIHFTGRRRPGDPLAWVGCNKLLTRTGFRTRFDIEQGLSLTVDWCRRHR
jgi:UDP-glucose 4-epimerase